MRQHDEPSSTTASIHLDRCIWRLLGRIETIADSVVHDDEEARQLIRDAIAAFDARAALR